MPAPPKIPPNLHDAIMALVGEGKTSEAIRQWLESTHGVKVSDRAVRDLITKKSKHRGELIDAATKEHLAKSLPKDLAALDKAYEDLENLREEIREAQGKLSELEVKHIHGYGWLDADIVAKQAAIMEKKLKLSGVGSTSAENLADLLGKALSDST